MELIDPVTAQWDEQLMCDIFYPVDAMRILQIPLNFQAFDDFIAWHLTKHGRFSVKSAYHEQWSHKYRGQYPSNSASTSNLQVAILKKLWELQVPRKIQIFCWRALRGIIPLKSILANKHIKFNLSCPACDLGPDNIKHLLFECKLVADV